MKDSLEIRPGLYLGGMESAMELVEAGEADANEFKVLTTATPSGCQVAISWPTWALTYRTM